MECFTKFFGNAVPQEFLRTLLLEAEEYAANAVTVKFNFDCYRNLLKELSVTLLYVGIGEIIVEVSLLPTIEARDFLLRVYSSLLSKSWSVELFEDRIHLVKKVSCRRIPGIDLAAALSSVLEDVGERCSFSFSGLYELKWYTER
ncbi:MAG: hypothetical protein N3G79_04400 [Sulfolobales archaeon]|nr:hypothetical protein [Sulfolobales archaeon]